MCLCVVSIAFGQESGKVRLLTPRADSPTAMVRCGAVLADTLVQYNTPRQYIFTGEETLTDMRYCVKEATTSVVDSKNKYHVPVGTIGWVSEDGKRVVFEECVNDATCEGCNPPEPPPPPPAPVCECPPPTPPPVEEVVVIPPPPADVPLKELPPPPDEWQPQQVAVTIVWDEHGRPLWSKFPVLNCGYQLIPGFGGFKRHGAWDIVEKATCAAGIAGGIYAGVSRGAAAAVKIAVCVPTMLPNGIWSVCGH